MDIKHFMGPSIKKKAKEKKSFNIDIQNNESEKKYFRPTNISTNWNFLIEKEI